ncbi:sucrase ferredoxin [Pleurocapsales cyanobacterium LEGE 06147]|nr:sucrase ferredoxin [Pleurocapsales cyanobacterium LEGE 06147]
MTDNNLQTDCRFCSTVSKANGEDPIGSADPRDQWLLIEMPLPWPRPWSNYSRLQPIEEEIEQLWQEDIDVRLLLIAQERNQSSPHQTRVLHYQRPPQPFARFAKQEFVVLNEQVSALAIALLRQSHALNRFQPYRQDTDGSRELLVCTDGQVDVACARFGYPIYEQLRQDYAAVSGGKLRVWRCSHFWGHQFAPTLIDFPEGRYWGHLEPDVLDLLVYRQGPVSKLRRFYRGWAGLTEIEQIVERELWMQHGWDWLSYRQAGQVLAIDETQDEPDWAEVRLEFTSPDGKVSGAYEARVEVCGQVTTMRNSGVNEPLRKVKQYQVTQLCKVA